MEKVRKLDLPEVFMERKEHFIQGEAPLKQRREIGRFERDKNWTYEVIMTKKER